MAPEALIDVDDEFQKLFDLPEGEAPALPEGMEVEDLDEEQFFPLSQKISMSPIIDESVAASASELLFSELSEKTKLLKLVQKEAQEYKLKYQALMSANSAARKRQRDMVPPQASASMDSPDEAPKKKHSPDVPKAPDMPEPGKQPTSDSDDEVPLRCPLRCPKGPLLTRPPRRAYLSSLTRSCVHTKTKRLFLAPVNFHLTFALNCAGRRRRLSRPGTSARVKDIIARLSRPCAWSTRTRRVPGSAALFSPAFWSCQILAQSPYASR